MRKLFLFFLVSINVISFSQEKENTNPKIYIAFLWHMHQPIYWPYENVVQTHIANRYPFSIFDIFNQRVGPYTNWPRNAVQRGINANMPHFGSQVSLSGSLIENLNNLESHGNQNFSNWKSHWNIIKNQTTSLGNPRMDLVGFGYHHPLMGLIDKTDISKQVQYHKEIFANNFPGPYSKGIFPPENAFSPRMIPALVEEGFQWVLVDNIHFERACINYPFSAAGNIYEPNKADVVNPNPGDWIQLNGLWAPTKVSARWSRQPRYVAYVDPQTGQEYKIIAVPADRYLGNEDGRGGFGALNYEAVLSQLEPYNTDPNRPILVVLHHDGDNFGGGSESYYNSNFQAFVNWLQANSHRFECTTIQDYLQRFPPNQNEVIHIEDGSWSGADNGDPEFKKWNGDPDPTGYSPDRNSWGIITAAKNFIQTAEQINPNSINTKNAWKHYLNALSSDYWYWDGSLNGIWDSHPARASNFAIPFAQQVILSGQDLTGPTIYLPQREPYNPGGMEWGIPMTNNLSVWTYVFDLNGLSSVKLKYRLDLDGVNNPNNNHNETYTGGADVTDWVSIDMQGTFIQSRTNPQPIYKAREYSASITGLNNKLVDYYVEAVDSLGNISKSPIRHVWIGNNTGGGGGGGNNGVSWIPANPTKNDTITIIVSGVNKGGKLHWGVNNQGNQWNTPNQVYWPAGSYLFNQTGPAVQSPMQGPINDTLMIKIGPFNNPIQFVNRVAFVIHFNDNTWNNNNGNDYHITIDGSGGGGQTFVMDGQVDAGVPLVASNQGLNLYCAWNGTQLYVATNSAQSTGKDHFIFITDSLNNMIQAPWAKNGLVTRWSAFLGNESINNWSGWFDHNGGVQNAAGSFLEGTIGLQNELGYLPQRIFVAVGSYETPDAGILFSQVPAGNGNGNIEPSEFLEVNLSAVSIKDNFFNNDFILYQNYPNPFNPSTVISYKLPVSSKVTIKVFDILGNEIKTLVDDYKSAGYNFVEFNASNLSSGIYFYTIKAGDFFDVKKMTLLR